MKLTKEKIPKSTFKISVDLPKAHPVNSKKCRMNCALLGGEWLCQIQYPYEDPQYINLSESKLFDKINSTARISSSLLKCNIVYMNKGKVSKKTLAVNGR